MKSATKDEQMEIISKVFPVAVTDAIETHRRMGRSIVVSRGGKVCRVKPGEITPHPPARRARRRR